MVCITALLQGNIKSTALSSCLKPGNLCKCTFSIKKNKQTIFTAKIANRKLDLGQSKPRERTIPMQGYGIMIWLHETRWRIFFNTLWGLVSRGEFEHLTGQPIFCILPCLFLKCLGLKQPLPSHIPLTVIWDKYHIWKKDTIWEMENHYLLSPVNVSDSRSA